MTKEDVFSGSRTPLIHRPSVPVQCRVLSPEALAERLVQAHDLETAFLGKVGGVPAGLMVLRTVPALSDAEDWPEIT